MFLGIVIGLVIGAALGAAGYHHTLKNDPEKLKLMLAAIKEAGNKIEDKF
jgi:hypothetical protein